MSVSSSHECFELYPRLERTTRLIALHPDCSGKAEAMRRCRIDIEERFREGRMTNAQQARLLAILDGDVSWP